MDCYDRLTLVRRVLEDVWTFVDVRYTARAMTDLATALEPDARSATLPGPCGDVLDRYLADLDDGHLELAHMPGRLPYVWPLDWKIRALISEQGTSYLLESRPDSVGQSVPLSGARVLEVDDRTVDAQAAWVSERTPASTATGRHHRVGRRLLLGEPGAVVTVRWENPDGSSIITTIRRPEVPYSRRGQEDFYRERARRLFINDAARELDGGFHHVQLQMISEGGPVGRAIDVLDSIRESTSGILLDVRGGSGGDYEALKRILARLFAEDVVIGDVVARLEGETKTWFFYEEYQADRSRSRYTGPLVVLIDGGCVGMCHVLASVIQREGRGPLVGSEATGGGSGEVRPSDVFFWAVQLPFDLVIPYFVARTDKQGDWLDFQEVFPDVSVSISRTDLVAGRDPVLAVGIRELARLAR